MKKQTETLVEKKLREINEEKNKLTYKNIDSRLLQIDTYQRQTEHYTKEDWDLIEELIEKFDPRLFGVILVAIRNGIFYVIDGWHRVTAYLEIYKRANIVPPEILCQVFESNDRKKEAVLFNALQQKKVRMKAFDIQICEEIQGEKEAVKFRKMISDLNMDISKKQQAKNNIIQGIDIIKDMFKENPESTKKALLFHLKITNKNERPNRTLISGFWYLYNHTLVAPKKEVTLDNYTQKILKHGGKKELVDHIVEYKRQNAKHIKTQKLSAKEVHGLAILDFLNTVCRSKSEKYITIKK